MAKAKKAKKAPRAAKRPAKARARRRVQAIPPHLRSVTPHLVVRGGAEAIQFYKKAFGARELMRSTGPDGKSVMHAEVKIGDSVVFLADEFPGSPMKSPQSVGGTTFVLNVYVKDCDALYSQAVTAGAKPLMPPADMFWGDRYSQVEDPFGHAWAIATHKEDVAPKEMEKRAAQFFASMK